MAPAKHGLADGHEVRDHVVAIPDKLLVSVWWQGMAGGGVYFLKIIRDQGLGDVS